MTPVRLEHVIAREMATFREDRGWTQARLASRMTANGLKWTGNRVTQIETLRRPISLVEAIALAWVFEVPLTRLLAGDDDIEMPGGAVVPTSHLRAAIVGDNTIQQKARYESGELADETEEIQRAAKNLGVDPPVLAWLTRVLFGRQFLEEREVRTGDVSGLPKRSAQTKRGHATRAMIEDLREHIEREGLDEVMRAYREFRWEIHQRLVERLKPKQGALSEDSVSAHDAQEAELSRFLGRGFLYGGEIQDADEKHARSDVRRGTEEGQAEEADPS